MRSNTTFAITFFPRKGKSNSTGQSLYARITVNSQRTEFSLKRKIQQEHWDPSKRRMRGNSIEARQINNLLDQTRTQIFEAYNELRLEKKMLNPEIIKARFLNEDIESHSLIQALDYHKEIAKHTIRYGTLKNYYTTEKYIKLFLKEKLKSNDIFLSQLSYSFITKFESFLRLHVPKDHQKPMGNNTVMKHLQRFRKIIRLTVKLEWIEKDPFQNFSAKYIKNERQYLSAAELENIETKTLTIPRLSFVRDMFVFSCYTGLSYIDVYNLESKEIVHGIDGSKWIYTSRVKTGNDMRIPILPKAEALINKYKDHPKLKEGKVFPCISNQKLNAYLKEIADICGITKNLTFHIARHTFATTVTLTNGVPLSTVSKLLGHSKISTTQIYAKVIEHKVSEDMMALKQKLSGKTTEVSISKSI